MPGIGVRVTAALQTATAARSGAGAMTDKRTSRVAATRRFSSGGPGEPELGAPETGRRKADRG
jgi:outer membrane translocation and assembly module TamA